jgi:hypothetical protein
MARTMLGEYKTSKWFWSEAVNTACHAINHLYLHCLLKNTSYELLTSNKPSVSYFCVFGSKCYILVKKGRHSKFAPKAIEGFSLGYDTNTKAYKVFNKSSGLVEVSSDVVFDETNGSKREQVDIDNIDEHEVPTAAMRTMAIGDVRPQEQQVQDQPSSSTMVQPQLEMMIRYLKVMAWIKGSTRTGRKRGGRCTTCTSNPSLHQHTKDHPVDQILSDISNGVTTRSRIANFCEHYSFVSSIEPFNIEEAMHDPG